MQNPRRGNEMAQSGDVLASGYKKYLDELKKVKVEKDLSGMKPKEVVSADIVGWCVTELEGGTTWDELRRKVNLGPAHLDNRWRKLRHTLSSYIIPQSDEEALTRAYDDQLFLTKKVEKFLEKAEARHSVNEGSKEEHQFLKVELEALKVLAERTEKKLEGYLEVKKLMRDENRKRGPSIIYQNNYYVPRPGDEGDKVKEVVDISNRLEEE